MEPGENVLRVVEMGEHGLGRPGGGGLLLEFQVVLHLSGHERDFAEEAVASDSAAKSKATAFMHVRSTEVLVQAAMLVDATVECLLCARLLGDEKSDRAKLSDEVPESLERLQCHLPEGQCVALLGYMSFMLKNSKRLTWQVEK